MFHFFSFSFYFGDECWKLTKKQFHNILFSVCFFWLFVRNLTYFIRRSRSTFNVFVSIKIYAVIIVVGEGLPLRKTMNDPSNVSEWETKKATLNSWSIVLVLLLFLRVTETSKQFINFFSPLTGFTIVSRFRLFGCLVLIISLFCGLKELASRQVLEKGIKGSQYLTLFQFSSFIRSLACLLLLCWLLSEGFKLCEWVSLMRWVQRQLIRITVLVLKYNEPCLQIFARVGTFFRCDDCRRRDWRARELVKFLE